MNQDLGTALTSAISRMEQNHGQGASGSLAHVPTDRPVIELRFDGDVAVLPRLPTLPAPSEPLHRALRFATPEAPPPSVRDEDGRIIWVAPKPITIGIPAEIRTMAAERAALIDAVLQPVAHSDLIDEWLLQWAQGCGRRKDQDFAAWRLAILRAVSQLPAVVFSDETATLAAQKFEFLPTPASLHSLLVGYVAPLREAADAARRVASAPDPAPPARERAPGDPFTPDELEERRKHAAATMAFHRAEMAKVAAERRRREGKNPATADAPSYLDAFSLAVRLRQEIAAEGPEALVAASRIRLAALLKIHPHIADLLTTPERAPAEVSA